MAERVLYEILTLCRYSTQLFHVHSFPPNSSQSSKVGLLPGIQV